MCKVINLNLVLRIAIFSKRDLIVNKIVKYNTKTNIDLIIKYHKPIKHLDLLKKYFRYSIPCAGCPDATVIRRINPNGTLNWMTIFTFIPLMKSLALDPQEQSVYYARNTNPINIIKANSSTGNTIAWYQYVSIQHILLNLDFHFLQLIK